MVYLALYKGNAKNWKKRVMDRVVKVATQSQYSHCELAIDDGSHKMQCYSASLRDGGVRTKRIYLHDGKWDLVSIPDANAEQIKRFYASTKGAEYDIAGALGVVLGIAHSKRRYFCSEWIAACLGFANPEKYSPETLAKEILVKHKSD